MIRKAKKEDLSRIAEIFVFNNRINYFPIFQDAGYSFGELQVVSVIDRYFSRDEVLRDIYVYDDGLVKGFLLLEGTEIGECNGAVVVDEQGTEIGKLYVEPCFQSQHIGQALIRFAIDRGADLVWALEKNTRAIAFYARHGFRPTGEKKFEEGTTEYLVELRR